MIRRMMVAVVLAGIAGCSAQLGPVSERQPPSIPIPQPVGVQTSVSLPLEPDRSCNPRESYRPLRPMPAPGAMPAGSPMAEIHRRGQLVVGIGTNAYLLAFQDPLNEGEMRGFEVEIVKEIAFAIFGDRDPNRITWRATNAADRIAAVRGHNDQGELVEPVDLVLAAMAMTCERKQHVAFSVEYYTARQRVLVNRDSTVKSIDDLGGKRVCASATSVNLRPIAQAPSRPEPVAAANTSDCLLMLQQGQVDAVSTGDVILAGLAKQDPATHIVGTSLLDDPVGIAMSKDSPDLVRFVNGVLERFIADGSWAQEQKSWFAEQIGEATPPVPQYGPE